MSRPLGIHVLYELYDCDRQLLDEVDYLRRMLYDAAGTATMIPLKAVSHKYQPQGVSVVLLIAESHMSVHTWPENGYAAVDFFSCRIDVDPDSVKAVVENALKAKRLSMQIIERGDCRQQ